jgi:hypothetical protein
MKMRADDGSSLLLMTRETSINNISNQSDGDELDATFADRIPQSSASSHPVILVINKQR